MVYEPANKNSEFIPFVHKASGNILFLGSYRKPSMPNGATRVVLWSDCREDLSRCFFVLFPTIRSLEEVNFVVVTFVQYRPSALHLLSFTFAISSYEDRPNVHT